MEGVQISPDGSKLAAIINSGDMSLLVTRDIAGGEIKPLMSGNNLEFHFNWFQWVNAERLIVSLRYPSSRADSHTQLIETTETRLLAINADGTKGLNLVKESALNGDMLRWAVLQDKVVSIFEDGQHLLLALPASEDTYDHAVYKINVYTAQRSHYANSRKRVTDWIADQQHRVRIGIGRDSESVTAYWVCDVDGSNWRLLSQGGAFDAEVMRPLGFGLDPHLLYVRAAHEGLQAVHRLDLRKPGAALELVYADPKRDVGSSLIRDGRGEVVGVGVTNIGDSSASFWDPRFKEWQAAIDKALPGSYNHIDSCSRDSRVLVIESEPKGRPPRFQLLQLGDKPSMQLVAQSYPELEGVEIGAKKSISFKARDGMEIHGYLTLPPHAVKGKALPMVVFPHGGPQSLDGPDFDYWVAFMADRGYAVLQVNFRGSTGYGQAFMEAGLRRWGLEMQDDLTDAVAEAVRRGVADPARVAIVGASYGGYAALMGAAKTPDLYRGAFAFAPVTDLHLYAAEAVDDYGRDTIRRQIGDPSADRKQLMDTSPCRLAARIQVPVVLVHGTLDRQVEHKHSVLMAEALKAAGKPHEFITQKGGDHQLSHLPYRRQLFTALEQFLDRVLAPAAG